ncbi:MAG: TlpA family protein disulfide reductase [Caldilineaceae bacterium SB0675_bin_29]|uniref:TlpA family protein disulfide reductase n=1 Tax=Caldilineaceae bacterium SB0675_bin_29 TaxID=2605266 RepID=A0A6B1G143_9CHLR|nr:TlpA family protein disulfide reductase [Caldilineaceae bacterium SB0675_bin_29]
MKQPSVVTAVVVVAVLLAACATAAPGEMAPDGFTPTPLEQFPGELGNGFPVANLVGEGSPDVGETAPNFAFFLADGRGADLASLQGKPVVLNFWATWCGPCRAEMPDLVALHESDNDLVVLEVNVGEELSAVEEFAKEFGMNMTVVLDEEDLIRRAYQVRNMPTTVFIRADGTIGARWPGFLAGEQLNDFVQQIKTQ